MTSRERRLLRIVIAPFCPTLALPTFDQWCNAVDALFPPAPSVNPPEMTK